MGDALGLNPNKLICAPSLRSRIPLISFFFERTGSRSLWLSKRNSFSPSSPSPSLFSDLNTVLPPSLSPSCVRLL